MCRLGVTVRRRMLELDKGAGGVLDGSLDGKHRAPVCAGDGKEADGIELIHTHRHPQTV